MAVTDQSFSPRGVHVEDVHVALGGGEVLDGVSLAAAPGSQIAVLGPSGCGKTTLLRALAGLQRIDAGQIRIGDRTVAAAGVHEAPEHRSVGLVFQDWALFPHLSVAANVAYGLPAGERGGRLSFKRQERLRESVIGLLEMVGVGDLAGRFPESLSGGQRQRVALARALAPRPSVLLLDEPFSSLDTNLRATLRKEVADLLREVGITAVYVTHDQDEAFVLGEEVVVLDRGRVVQQAAPAQMYAKPASTWLAQFVGAADVIAGEADGRVAETALGRIPLEEAANGPVQVVVRPEDVVLQPEGDAVVVAVEYFGHDTITSVCLIDDVVVRGRTIGAPVFAVGDQVTARHSGVPGIAFSVAEHDR